MKLHINKDGYVVGVFEDDHVPSQRVLDEGILVIPYDGPLEKEGEAPPVGVVDLRPIIMPTVLSIPGLLAIAADRRWKVQTGGIVVGTMPVRTDDKTRSEISQARADAVNNPGWSTKWKIGTGAFVVIDAASIEAIAQAVSAHLRACFDKEEEVAKAILAGTITSVAEIDASFASIVQSGT